MNLVRSESSFRMCSNLSNLTKFTDYSNTEGLVSHLLAVCGIDVVVVVVDKRTPRSVAIHG